MRLELPASGAAMLKQLTAKVRNQVKRGREANFQIDWGGSELLDSFHSVFSQNMRDLGTPTYGRGFFAAILRQFPESTELCVVRDGPKPIAGALLLQGRGVTEVPSASSLREYRKSNANMWMYWNLIERSAERRQEIFDFGRSTMDSTTYQFKKQWGAQPVPAEWQFHVRKGAINPNYRWKIALWRKLPVAITRRLGPMIVRGIP
jgi:FemAB-related protein (PEP-CTERM system-associated)